jgi:hypothetical protein
MEVAGAVGRVGTLVLFAAVLGRGCRGETAALDRKIAILATEEKVITVRRGDVSLRDAPKAHELRQGRFFSDPYYAGEHHWYPFVTPLVAAAVSKVTGAPIRRASSAPRSASWPLPGVAGGAPLCPPALAGPPAVAVVMALGALPPPHGSTRSSRRAPPSASSWPTLGGAGRPALSSPRAGPGRRGGRPGLWSGAPFFLAAAVAGMIAALAVDRAIRQQRIRESWRWLVPLALGVLGPLSLLFGPELLRTAVWPCPRPPELASEIYTAAARPGR